MTTYGTADPGRRRPEPTGPAALDLPNLVWALAATHFVSRAGGLVRSFLVLYLTQEQQLSLGDRGCGGRGGGRWRHRVSAARWLAGRPDRPTPHHAGRVLGDRRRAGRARFGGDDAGDLGGGRRCRADGGAVPPGRVGCGGRPPLAGSGSGPSDCSSGRPTSASRSPRSRPGSWPSSGYGLLFWINAAASVVAALIVWRCVPETRPPTPKQTRRALLPVLLRDRLMIAMVAIYVVYFTLFLQTFTTLPLVMTADGHGPATYGAVLALNGIVIVVVQPLAVRLLAGRDRSTVLAVSMLLVGVGVGLGADRPQRRRLCRIGPRLDPRRDRRRRHVRRHLRRPRAGRPARQVHGRRLHHVEHRRRARAAARHRAARPCRTNRAGGGMC